jgi:hypothetical protein
VYAKLSPEEPDLFVGHTVEVAAVFALEEVVYREDEWGLVDTFGEIEIVLNVSAERDRNKIEV